MSLNIGNIILYNDINYFILDKGGEELLCLPIKENEIKKTIHFLDSNNLDFNNTIIINNKEKIDYVANSNPELVLFVLRKYKKFLNVLEVKNNPKIGSIIKKGNKYYYIFSEEEQKWIVFELSKNEILDGDVFTFDGNIYYTDYFQTIINKNDIFDGIYQCSEGQIILLKRKKLSYRKNELKRIPISNESIVKIDQTSNEEYVVKSNLGNKLICVSNYDKNPKYSKKHYLNKEDVVFVKVKQIRK